jgi:hypothetical protein
MSNAHLLQPHPPPSGPGLMVRLATWYRRERLDEQLAAGSDPGATAELRLRAEQLGSSTEHIRLAERLEDVVRRARTPGTTSWLPRRREVRACVDELLALAGRLRSDEQVRLSGVAMTERLLSDGLGPLYFDGANVPLREAIQSARAAL